MRTDAIASYIIRSMPPASPMARGAVLDRVRQRIPVNETQFSAAIALAVAKGDILRMFGGTVITRVMKGGGDARN